MSTPMVVDAIAEVGLPAAPVVDVVVPVYNEADQLEDRIGRLHRFLRDEFPFSWRVTIVDNASTDATWDTAQLLAALLPGVRARHLDRKGRGLALRTAWSESDADVVAYMDVDLSTGLDALLPLVAPLVSGHSDVAIGSRLAAGAAVARGPKREVISRTYNLILRTVFGTRVRDAQCGFKALRTDVARRLLPEIADDAWFFDTELLLLAEHNGLRIHQVPVDWVDDPDSRVDITATAAEDLRGVARLARRFLTGRGRVELGPATRHELDDDMGRRLVSFAAVGAVSTAISLVLFLSLRGPMGPITANLVALAATASSNAWANRHFTIERRGRAGRRRHYADAATVLGFGVVLSTAALMAARAAGGGLVLEVPALAAAWSAATIVRFAMLGRRSAVDDAR